MSVNKITDNNLYYKLAICLLALFVVFFYLGFDEIYYLPPQSTHHWRQSDGFSMAVNYYQFNLSLFKPEMHHILGGNGRAVGEFPILYYITGKLFHIFGISYSVFRIVHFLPFMLSLLYLAYFLFKKVEIPIFSVLSACIFLFASPLIAYYSLNFLPNVPSLGFLFAGCILLCEYLFYETTHKKFSRKLVWATVMLALATLLKPTSATAYCAFIFVVFVSLLFPKFAPYIKKEKKIPVLLSCFIIAFLSVIWFYYAAYYQKVNHTTCFLLDVLPYWKADKDTISFIDYRTKTLWMPVLAHKYILRIAVLSCLFSLVSSIVKKHYFISVFILVALILDVLVYLLFYQAFSDHDYYFINFFGLGLIIFVLSLYYLQSYNIPHKRLSYIKYVLPAFLLFVIMLSLSQSDKILRERYAINSPWKNNFNSNLYHPDLRKYVESIGLTPKTKVISIPDGSPNNTLCLLNLKGITDLYHGYRWANDLGGINEVARENSIKYLVVVSPEWINREDFKKIKCKELGHFESIYFFELLP